MTPGDYEAAARILREVGFVGWQIVVMGAVGYAESHLNPAARNLNDANPDSPWYMTTDWGAWQINDNGDAVALYVAQRILAMRGSIGKQLLDPVTNARAARALFVSRGGDRDPVAGYAAWAAFDNGTYAQFKPQAYRAAKTIGAV